MKIGEAFPSNYLKASDVGNKTVKVTIDRVVMEDLGDESKPVVYFRGADRGMVLNKTNANTLADAYGQETNDWRGKEGELFTRQVEFQGKTVPGLRIRIPESEKPPLDEDFSAEGLEDSGSDLPF